jgi:hypothetical protein
LVKAGASALRGDVEAQHDARADVARHVGCPCQHVIDCPLEHAVTYRPGVRAAAANGGYSFKTVRSCLHQCGIAGNPSRASLPCQPERQVLIEHSRSIASTAATHGCHDSTVHRHRRRLGIEARLAQARVPDQRKVSSLEGKEHRRS